MKFAGTQQSCCMGAMVNPIFKSLTPPCRREIWQRFLDDQKLHKTYRVSHEEMNLLMTFAPFGQLRAIEDILFILKRIRHARGRF